MVHKNRDGSQKWVTKIEMGHKMLVHDAPRLAIHAVEKCAVGHFGNFGMTSPEKRPEGAVEYRSPTNLHPTLFHQSLSTIAREKR